VRIVAEVLIENADLRIEHEAYYARLQKTVAGYSIKPVEGTEKRKNSFGGLAQEKTGKVYIVRKPDNSIVYIGKTSQRLSQRFYRGLNTESDRWYDGYSWKECSEVAVHCLVVRDKRPEVTKLATSERSKHLDRLAEALEADLVFHFRKRFGEWPSDQTEIHFANVKVVQQVSETLFDTIQGIVLFPRL